MDVDNWDLEAVVRGCCFKRPSTTITSTAAADPISTFPSLVLKEEEQVDGKKHLAGFPDDIMDTETVFREPEDPYNPFFHQPHQQQLQQQSLLFPQQSRLSSSPAVAEPHQTQKELSSPQRPFADNPRSKRRKNQQTRVVCHVPADGLYSDMWAWRKYGQKPIKGSPYPRGYYRCSSSKGCLARKQVEKSRTDPAMLVVTYTADHNHAQPTHRNSLAGSTRQKLPTPPAPAAGGGQDGDRMPPSSTPSSCVEDEHLRQRKGEQDEDEEEEVLTVADIEMVGEEDVLFLEFKEGGGRTGVAANSGFYADEGGFAEHFFASTWMANSNAAAAAGGG